MLDLHIVTYNKNAKYTESKLFRMNDNEELCDVLEDTIRDVNSNGKFDNDEKKVYGQTAIPAPTKEQEYYELEIYFSPKFKKEVVLIKGISKFTGVEFHYGRTVKNSAGCPLVGKKIKPGELQNTGMTDKLVKMLKDYGEKGRLYITR